MSKPADRLCSPIRMIARSIASSGSRNLSIFFMKCRTVVWSLLPTAVTQEERQNPGLPLYARIEAAHAGASVGILSYLHRPNGGGRSGSGDFENGCKVGTGSTLGKLDVTIWQKPRGTSEERENGGELVDPGDFGGLCVFVDVVNRDAAFAGRYGGTTGRSAGIHDALITVIKHQDVYSA